MAKVIKYYSFTDPATGLISKDVGYEDTREVKNVQIREINGVLTLTKNEVKEVTHVKKPKYAGLREISKEEYDKLDVSGEHEFLTKQRKRSEHNVSGSATKDFIEKTVVKKDVSGEEALEQIGKATGKPIAKKLKV